MKSARLYNCARCSALVIICRDCDRGNQYCQSGCAEKARRASVKRAGKKYQSTRRGKHFNAKRQRRHRERQRQKVTHHGSLESPPHVLLPTDKKPEKQKTRKQRDTGGLKQHSRDRHAIRCAVCGQRCDVFLRRDFLRTPTRHRRRE